MAHISRELIKDLAGRKFIAELEAGVWVADFSGNNQRTLKEENAKIFNNKSTAWRAIEKYQKEYPFKNAKVVEAKKRITCRKDEKYNCSLSLGCNLFLPHKCLYSSIKK